MSAKLYGKLVGVVLLLVAAAGLAMPTLLGMDLSKRHSLVHGATGALLVFIGFGSTPESTARTVALVFGIVYAGLGAWGFFTGQILPGMRIFHTDMLTNVIHLGVGLLGVVAGVMAPKSVSAA